jgi:hypothetical protein
MSDDTLLIRSRGRDVRLQAEWLETVHVFLPLFISIDSVVTVHYLVLLPMDGLENGLFHSLIPHQRLDLRSYE